MNRRMMGVLIFLILHVFLGISIGSCKAYLFSPAPKVPLSGKVWPKGSPWPIPFSWTSTRKLVTFNRETFKIVKEFQEGCEPMDFAIQKYNRSFLFPLYGEEESSPYPSLPILNSLRIEITEEEHECDKYPKFSDDPGTYESYDLEISYANGGVSATAFLYAKTVWGILRGLETFSQLIWSNEDGIPKVYFFANHTIINDKPRFSHRGLMIDSARHYLPERIFYEILDGMMYTKLNVLHWHIVDDQSFPFVSQTFPQLSAKGAFNRDALYTPETVQRIINGARLRGIRVIFEFDTPGHTYSWSKAFPQLLTPCYGLGPDEDPETPNYPEHAGRENLDPTNDFTYKFLQKLFTEIKVNVTKDAYIHLGMDETYWGCWDPSRNPQISDFMKEHNYTKLSQVQGHYTKRHVEMVKSLGLIPISWQDPLDFEVELDKSVIIQVWKNTEDAWVQELDKVLQKGYRAILSSPWYINYIEYGETWKKYYTQDPIQSLEGFTVNETKQILGGEACIWGESVDKTNIIPLLFPFVSAIGERLWSFELGTTDEDANNARGRLDQHRCHLLRRGLNAQPILNGYCGRWETEARR